MVATKVRFLKKIKYNHRITKHYFYVYKNDTKRKLFSFNFIHQNEQHFLFHIHTCIISNFWCYLTSSADAKIVHLCFFSFECFSFFFLFLRFFNNKMKWKVSWVSGVNFVWKSKKWNAYRYSWPNSHLLIWMFILIKIEYHFLLHLIFFPFSFFFKWVFLLWYIQYIIKSFIPLRALREKQKNIISPLCRCFSGYTITWDL